MAKTVVFSWKIDNSKYGYLCGPEIDNNKPMICDRITTHETLKQISDKVSEWDYSEYSENFDELKEMISEYTQGSTISGTADNYYFENDNDKNYIVLTGKDGYNGSKQEQFKSLKEDILKEINSHIDDYIDKKFNLANVSLKNDMSNLKTETISKIEHANMEFTSKVEEVEEQLEESNSILEQRLLDASRSIEAATKIFNLEAANITVEKLNSAIEDSRDVKIWKESAKDKILAHDELIEYCKNRSETDSARVNMLSEKVDEYRADAYDRIALVANEVESVNNKVNSIYASKEAIQTNDNESEIALSKSYVSQDMDSYVSETETIENGDGTFDIKTTIGDETFNIKVFGFGKKLRINGSEDVNGLILANNGFKYLDKNGSFISIINGNIRLSNSDGSGKIEIKDDGVYINGKKV